MNGEWWGTATGENMLNRPNADFGPTWLEMAGFISQYKKAKQKNTYAGKLSHGAKCKFGAVLTQNFNELF
jgi:hypothetical protein